MSRPRTHLTLVAALLGLVAFGPVAARAQLLTTTPLSPADIEYEPHRWTGIVHAYKRGSSSVEWRGSGSVARHPKIVISCAHLIHTSTAWFDGDFRWFRKWPSSTMPTPSQGLLMRGVIRWASYHQEKRNDIAAGIPSGLSSTQAFDYDIAAFWSFENTAGGESAPFYADGRTAMKSHGSKMVSGYPGRPFGTWTWQMFRTGPFTDRFVEQRFGRNRPGSTVRYMRPGSRNTVYLGGNSGGPLWVRGGNGIWGQAGVFVSGGTGTTALDTAAWNIITQAITASGGSSPPSNDDHPNTPDNATVVTAGVARSGVLERGGDIDFFQVRVPATADYVIETTGSTDTFGVLLDANRSVVEENDDFGTTRNFRISRRLSAGVYYVRVNGYYENTTGPYSLLVSGTPVTSPSMTVEGGAYPQVLIPNGAAQPMWRDGTDLGHVKPNETWNKSFTLRNVGNGILNFTGNPRVSITGAGSSAFSFFPLQSSVPPGGQNFLTIFFQPKSPGVFTATITIPNSDSARNPYTFTVRGESDDHSPDPNFATSYGVNEIDSMNATLEWGGDADCFRFNVPVAADYVIQTTGPTDTLGALLNEQGSVIVQDDNSGSGGNFRISRRLSAGSYVIRVRGSNSGVSGPYALSVNVGAIAVPDMNVMGLSSRPIQPGSSTPEGANGTHFGNVTVNESLSRTFTVKNTGKGGLSLTDTPRVRLSGTGASHFTVTSEPTSVVPAGASTQLTIRFRPSSRGAHRAIVSIASSDQGKNPYTFAVEGNAIDIASADDHGNSFAAATAVGAARSVTGNINYGGDEDYFSFSVAQAGIYTIQTKGTTDTRGDLYNAAGILLNSGNDSGDDSNFRLVSLLTPGTYHVRVAGYGSQTTGDYRLEITQKAIEPEISITTSNLTPILHGSTSPSAETGTDFGSTLHAAGQVERVYRVDNMGFASLLLNGDPKVTGGPRVAISGSGASHFQVVSHPAGVVARGGSTTFRVRYRPVTPGKHDATVTIANNDSDESPFTFMIRGEGSGDADDHGNTPTTATSLALGSSVPGVLERGGDVDVFRFVVPEARPVTVRSSGQTDTAGDLLDAAGRQLLQNDNSGGDLNFSISRVFQPGTYFIRVRGASRTIVGPYRVHVDAGPRVSTGLRIADSGGRLIPPDSAGAPGAEFGSIAAVNAVSDRAFILQNTGEGAVQLTGSPTVRVLGLDAAAFSVFREPAATVIPARTGAVPFAIRFDPRRVGLHSATVEIRSDDLLSPLYRFAISGTGTGAPIMPDDHGDDRLSSTRVAISSTTPGQIGHAGDRDWLSFVVPRESMVTLFTTGGTDTYGHLHNTAGQELAFDDDSGSGSNFLIARKLAAGTYFVRVRGTSAEALGSYSLNVQARDVQPAITMRNLATDFGSVAAGTGSRTLEFLVGNTGDGILVLEGLQKVTITGNAAIHFALITQPASSVQPGAFTRFAVRYAPRAPGSHAAILNIWSNNPAASGGSPYTIRIEGSATGFWEDDHDDTSAGATLLPLDPVGLAGVINIVGDVDYFRITVPSAEMLAIESEGTTDTFGTLYDSNGQIITEDDDAGSNLNFMIRKQVSAGVYFLRISGYSSSTIGPYHVRATLGSTTSGDDHGDLLSNSTPIPFPGTLQGLLTAGDVDVFRFTLSRQSIIRVYTAGFTDTLGDLYAADGRQIESDDDTGDNNNFDMSRLLPAGTYYIQVRGFNGAATGGYTLHLTGLEQ